ncbi:HD-GYP domain-containing protein [Salirhabdus salicampi]|uniref:HD-GYP domain-containing protein n=1 Tax=Salirhabdus salicampi TaxID=476102 RepID=UPI0020C4BFFB|nr:HD domain-containing phosphohydrolase [Salirhabdus salicampi]MCP8615744.1 HD domain-containing protein [Salirhabdus salicampi]
MNNTSGLNILRQEPLERVTGKGIEVDLLASGDGTEVILHKLEPGAKWGIDSGGEEWDGLEYFYILRGELLWNSDKSGEVLTTGNSVFTTNITEHYEFIAQTYVEFLYVSSRPVFHIYSIILKRLRELAISVEQKDGYTADHCNRIMELSMKVGEELDLSASELYQLNLSSFFHDVGKVSVPESILNKPSKLTSQEWETMKTHTTKGRELLEESDLPDLQSVGYIVEQHHERYDGKGYPHGLKGDEIDIKAAIIAVVDSYDAMTTDRVYQKGRSKEEALKEIKRCRGTMYNPKVVDIFLRIAEKID